MRPPSASGREDFGEQQHLLVGQVGGQQERADVHQQHPHVLGLAAGVAAVKERSKIRGSEVSKISH